MQETYLSGDVVKAYYMIPVVLEKADKKLSKKVVEHADVYNLAGVIYQSLGSYDTALAYYWTAMEMVKPVVGEQSYDYAAYGFNLADTYYSMGQYSAAEPWFQFALPHLAEAYGSSSVEYTGCFHKLALLYTDMGRYAEARPMSEAAVSFYKEILGEDDEDYQGAHSNLARIYQGLGMYAEAQQIFTESIAYARRSNNPFSLYISLNNLAELYRVTGNYDEALPLYMESEKVLSKVSAEDPTGQATLDNNMGLLYSAKGQFADAERRYSNAIKVYEGLGMSKHPDITNPMNNLGELYRVLGRHDEAIAQFTKVIELRAELTGEQQPQYANALNNLALVYTDKGSLEEAQKLLLQALEIYEVTLGQTHKYYANCMNNLATVYAIAGYYEESVDLFKQALVIYKDALGDDHETYAVYLSSLGEAYSRMGEHAKALESLKEALTITERKMGKTYPGAVDIAGKLAESQRNAGNFEKAKSLYSSNLADQLKQVKAFFPVMNDDERSDYYQTIAYRFELFNSFVIEQSSGKDSPDGELTELMYNFHLQTKGILLSEITALRKKILSSDDAELIELFENWQEKRLDLMLSYRMSNSEKADAGIDQEKLEAEVAELEKSLNQRSAVFNAKSSSGSANWKDVQEQLKPGEAAMEILRVNYYKNQWTDTVYYLALLILPDSEYPTMIPMINGASMDKAWLSHYRTTIHNELEDNLSYERYWGEIAPKLKGVKRLYCSVDGVYQQLNLYSLKNPKTQRYLLDDMQIHLVTSTRDLLSVNTKGSSKSQSAVLVGFPDYDLTDEPAVEGRATRTGLKAVEDLPATKDEVTQIATVLENASWSTDVLLQDAATEEAIKLVENPTVLHVATHGFFLESKYTSRSKVLGIDASKSRQNPMLRSGLLLAGVTAPVDQNSGVVAEDGILTAFEASGLQLDSTELVVLSACETGLGEVINGEGVYGLQRAFQVAGAKSLIMSLWQVSDDPTRELMLNFYKEWSENPEQGKQEAFRKAQQKLKEKYPHPFYWGAFILVGE